MNQREAALREALGIPAAATSVLILEQSAHCDWDWLATFQEYYSPGGDGHQAVKKTLEDALDAIKDYYIQPVAYIYTFCEVAYLRAFMEDSAVTADYKARLRDAAGKQFFFASGGITSADNILSHPEAFIRNYLLGRQWLEQVLGATAESGAVGNQMWIPDDFGHDAQLPVLLQAMGFPGAGFWRIPAQAGVYSNSCLPNAGKPNAPTVYLPAEVGLDFIWQADDGSKVQAHWLMNSYCEGNNELDTIPGTSSIDGSTATANIQTLIAENSTAAVPSPPYMFVPIDCDFVVPFDNGPTVFDAWNNSANGQSTHVVQATFDAFMQLVAAQAEEAPLPVMMPHPPAPSKYPPYIPNPYYSGFYASMPALKQGHYSTVRTLLLAEAMNLYLLQLSPSDGNSAAATLQQAWDSLLPSTHHDYITGTSPNGGSCGEDVYNEDQTRLLDQASQQAGQARDFILGRLAANAYYDGHPAVLLFNGTGIVRRGCALIPAPVPAGFVSSSADGISYAPIQQLADGSLLVYAEVPPFGLRTVYLSIVPEDPLVTLTPDGDTYTLSNGIIDAVIGPEGIRSLSRTGGANCLKGTGNQLRIFTDAGNIYRFGNEIPCTSAPFSWRQKNIFEKLTMDGEGGALAATVTVVGTLGDHQFTVVYELRAGDTALRISVTGAAHETNMAIMAYFEFATPATSLTFGTTSHWDNESPRQFLDWTWPSDVELMTFEATHDYVAAIDAQNAIAGAIYQQASPAWGIYGNGVLGCLLRNTPTTTRNSNAACASDTDTHTVTYAVAPPDGLQPPQAGAGVEGSMLAAALHLNNPFPGTVITAAGDLPPEDSLAWCADPRAIVTAIKQGTVDPGQMIVRLYQPTNAPINGAAVNISKFLAGAYSSSGLLIASAVNAMERPTTDSAITQRGSVSVTMTLPYAIETLALGG